MAVVEAFAVIERLGLESLDPEGGYFRRFHPCPTGIGPAAGGVPSGDVSSVSSAILYLVTTGSWSALHRLSSEEIWTCIAGDPVEQLVLHPDGSGSLTVLGWDASAGLLPVSAVAPGCWQGTRIVSDRCRFGWALFSTVVCPAYQDGDFTLADGSVCSSWPAWKETARRFLHPKGDACT